jgi:CRP-like cAMP-binding protein
MSITKAMSLDQTSMGAALSARSLQVLRELALPVNLTAGQMLFREGTKNPWIYLILGGHLDLSMTVPGRGAVRVLTLGPGDLAAWSAVVGDCRMTCSAQAIDSVELVALPSQALAERMQRDHEFGFEFMQAMAQSLSKRLVATRLQLLDLFSTMKPG